MVIFNVTVKITNIFLSFYSTTNISDVYSEVHPFKKAILVKLSNAYWININSKNGLCTNTTI